MVESPLGDITDIHRRSLTHSLKTLKDLDTVGGILLFRLFHFLIINHLLSYIIFVIKCVRNSGLHQFSARKSYLTNVLKIPLFCKSGSLPESDIEGYASDTVTPRFRVKEHPLDSLSEKVSTLEPH